METTKTCTAWMIRSDGTEIPVLTHVYADKNEIDELLALAYFLWKNDADSSKAILEFLDAWTIKTLVKPLPLSTSAGSKAIDDIMAYLSSKPYHIVPEEFAEVIADSSALLEQHDWGQDVDTNPIDGTDLLYTLNQRFMRARYGGRYDTVAGCRDMFFRISSVGFDWLPIICGFVEKRVDMIDTVTIVRDFESTGCEKYYADSANCPYNKMPIADFIAGTGSTNLLAENDKPGIGRLENALANGATVEQLYRVPANYGRIHDAIQRLKYKEEKNLINE